MIHSLNTNPAHSSDVATPTEYTIETYKAGYWTWIVRDGKGNMLAYGGYCRTRRKARNKAVDWIEKYLNPGVPRSKQELRDKSIKDRTMLKETYGG